MSMILSTSYIQKGEIMERTKTPKIPKALKVIAIILASLLVLATGLYPHYYGESERLTANSLNAAVSRSGTE